MSIARQVVRIPARSPDESHAPLFQLSGPWATRGSKPPCARTANTPPVDGQPAGPPTADAGSATPTIAASSAATNWVITETRKMPRIASVAPTTNRGRDRAGRVRRLAAGPADHDQVAQDQPAEGQQRDRDQHHRAVEGPGDAVVQRVDRREELAPQVVEGRAVGVADAVRIPDGEVADRVAQERDVADRGLSGGRLHGRRSRDARVPAPPDRSARVRARGPRAAPGPARPVAPARSRPHPSAGSGG